MPYALCSPGTCAGQPCSAPRHVPSLSSPHPWEVAGCPCGSHTHADAGCPLPRPFWSQITQASSSAPGTRPAMTTPSPPPPPPLLWQAHMEAVHADWKEYLNLLICEESHLKYMEDYHQVPRPRPTGGSTQGLRGPLLASMLLPREPCRAAFLGLPLPPARHGCASSLPGPGQSLPWGPRLGGEFTRSV